LQVLSELLKFGFNLLQPSLAILSALRSCKQRIERGIGQT